MPSIAEKLASRIVPIQESETTAKILVYGPSGIGKTTLAGLAPSPLIISCEGGNGCLRKLDKFAGKGLNIKSFKPENFGELRDIFTYLKHEKHDHQTVVIDSLTEVAKMSMDGILLDPDRDKKFRDDMPTLQDYGTNTQQMRRLVRAYRDLPLNVIFICLAMEDKDETDGSVRVRPSLTAKLAEDVFGYVDVVAYLFLGENDNKEPVRKLLTQPKGKYLAKDRFGVLGLGMVEPTGYEIIAKITGNTSVIPANLDEIKKEVKNIG
jgi:phage nucleotide-binding protein